MGGVLIVLGVAAWSTAAWAGAYVAREKRRDPAEGVAFGLIGGWLGVLVLAMLPDGAMSRDRRRPSERFPEGRVNLHDLGLAPPPRDDDGPDPILERIRRGQPPPN